MTKSAYECLYVLWWLAAVVVMAIICLALGFPHSLWFVPGVAAWLVVWTIVGVLVDKQTGGKFADGYFPFGLFGGRRAGET